MPHTLMTHTIKTRITKFVLSNDWASLHPWSHDGEPIHYFDIVSQVSDAKDVKLTFIYLGPFAIVSGKWIKE